MCAVNGKEKRDAIQWHYLKRRLRTNPSRFPRISLALHAGYWLLASRIGLSADVFFKPWIPAFAGMTA